MPDTFSDSPRYPGPLHDPARPPPRRRWSPVAVGLAAVAAVAGLVAALAVFGDTQTRALFFVFWLCLTLLAVKRFGGWVEDDEPPPRDD